MNLNCLTCQMKRTDSDNELNKMNMYKAVPYRSFSLKLGRRPPLVKSESVAAGRVVETERKAFQRNDLRRFHQSGPVEFDPSTPRLVRSSGMRRDWSFEDLSARL